MPRLTKDEFELKYAEEVIRDGGVYKKPMTRARRIVVTTLVWFGVLIFLIIGWFAFAAGSGRTAPG